MDRGLATSTLIGAATITAIALCAVVVNGVSKFLPDAAPDGVANRREADAGRDAPLLPAG